MALERRLTSDVCDDDDATFVVFIARNPFYDSSYTLEQCYYVWAALEQQQGSITKSSSE